MYDVTAKFRRMLDRIGVEYVNGYDFDDGIAESEKSVTTIWPVRGEFCEGLTFEEGTDGRLHTFDGLTPAMAVEMVVAASLEHDGRKI